MASRALEKQLLILNSAKHRVLNISRLIVFNRKYLNHSESSNNYLIITDSLALISLSETAKKGDLFKQIDLYWNCKNHSSLAVLIIIKTLQLINLFAEINGKQFIQSLCY